MRLFAAAIMLSAFSVAPALAQATDTPFQGATVTPIAGIDVSSGAGEYEARFVYGGQIGYDWQRGNTVFGVEAEIDGPGSRECFEHLISPTAPDRSCGKINRDIYVGGRIGRVVGGTTLLYLKAGYANTRSSYSYHDGGTGAGNYRVSDSRDGVFVGAGIEKAISDNVLIKAEYRYANYAEGLSRHQAVAGLGFRF